MCSTAAAAPPPRSTNNYPPTTLWRFLWAFVQQFDWSPWYAADRAVEGGPGALAIAPEVLFALWLFATTEGVTSARHLAELCRRDLPYQWLCGGEPINYWTLNDFYQAHAADLDRLFVEHIAALRSQELISLGLRDPGRSQARGSGQQGHIPPGSDAGGASGRSDPARGSREPAAGGHRAAESRQAAQERVATDRVARLQRAVSEVRRRQELRRQSKRADAQPEECAASESDPDAADDNAPWWLSVGVQRADGNRYAARADRDRDGHDAGVG